MMKISLGAVQYFWDRNTVLDFYARAVETPVDILYVGETVCSKRRALSTADWLALAQDIASAGKEVVLATLTLIEAESELSQARSLIEKFDGMIEANDYAVLHMAQQAGRAVCAGPTLNIYHPLALRTLQQCGVQRWVAPVEMSGTSLHALLQQMQEEGLPLPQTEVFSYGRLPLAHSARCYTARYANLPKDQCEFRCRDYPEGLPLTSQEGQGLFQLNGIQTQSYARCNLLPHWQQLAQHGVDIMRISAASVECLQQIQRLHDLVSGRAQCIPQSDVDDCNGYWFGVPGMRQVSLV